MRITSLGVSAFLVIVSAACSSAEPDTTLGAEGAALTRTGVFKGFVGKCLDAGAEVKNGVQTRLFTCNGSAAQTFTVTDAGQITGPGGKCLDVANVNPASGTSVIMWDCNGGPNQKWTLSGTQLIGLGGKCLDVANNQTADGSPLIIWDCHGGANQQWTFQPSSTTTSSGTTGDAGTGTSTGTGGSTSATTAPTTRDPFKWPFATNSIWNMPIGSSAVYVPANLSGDPAPGQWVRMPQMDEEHIVMRPTSPLTNINISTVGWSGGNRCSATGGLLVQVPMPSDFVIPNNIENAAASFLLADGRTITQVQPFARCTAGGPATAWFKFPNVDLYGDGRAGAHGGSGLSAVGGSLRIGELRPGSKGPTHVLKVNVYATQALYKCTTQSDCFRWPAYSADSSAVGRYGTNGNNQNKAMKMGALLALPASLDIATLGLQTEPGRQLAWTLQNYGAYIVDDTGAPQFALNAEHSPDGSFKTQFKGDYGFEFEQLTTSGSPWMRDIQRLVQALNVVDNNSPTSIGGGGTPREPLAPPL